MRVAWKCGVSLALALAVSVTAVPAQTKAFTGLRAAGQERAALTEGAYQVPVTLMHATQDRESSGNAALVQKAKVVVENGTSQLYFSFKEMVVQGMSGYLSRASVLSDITFDANGNPETYTETPVEVLSTYDVVDEYNKETSSDVNCAGKPYPKQMSATVASGETYVWMKIYIPIMASFNMGTQFCRIRMDYDKAAKYTAPDKTALESAIQKAEGVKTEDFTADSVKKLQSALKEARIVKENEYFLQQDVEEALAALNTAYNSLEANPADGEAAEDKPTNSTPDKEVTISLNKSKTVLYTKQKRTITLKAVVSGNQKVTWSSSNQKVATVSAAGKVTAKNAGTAVITAKAGSAKASCKIVVKKPSLKVANTAIKLAKNKKIAIQATATPAGKITYRSSNKKVATVSSKGIVKAKKKGQAKITVSCNGVKKTVKITVK